MVLVSTLYICYDECTFPGGHDVNFNYSYPTAIFVALGVWAFRDYFQGRCQRITIFLITISMTLPLMHLSLSPDTKGNLLAHIYSHFLPPYLMMHCHRCKELTACHGVWGHVPAGTV